MKKTALVLLSLLLAFILSGCQDVLTQDETVDLKKENQDSGEVIQAKEVPKQETVVEKIADKIWNGRTVTKAPERIILSNTLQILDIRAGSSDPSLMITLKNISNEDFHFNPDYALDVKIDGEWYEYASHSSAGPRGDYLLAPNRSRTMHFELYTYAQLPSGEYRISTREGISAEYEYVNQRQGEYEIYPVKTYPKRTADEVYESITEVCCQKTDWIDYSGYYVFENGGFHDIFFLEFMENHEYNYFEGMSAEPGFGTWEIQNGELILTSQSNDKVFYFLIEDNVLYYEAEKSDNFVYTRVADLDRFICKHSLWEEMNARNSEQILLYFNNTRLDEEYDLDEHRINVEP